MDHCFYDTVIKTITLSASNLPIGDIISSDPYFKFIVDGQTRHTSEVVGGNLSPVWKPVRLYMSENTLQFGSEECSVIAIQDLDVQGV